MSLVVKNNLSALNTLNIMNTNSTALNKSLKKVSSGMKINGAADDASGYQISERMRVQIRSLDQANANTQNGSSLLKTAEGAVSSTVEILKTLKEKVLNAANGTNSQSDLDAIQAELNQSIDQINDNANVTFNGINLTDGSLSKESKLTANVFTNNQFSTATDSTTALSALADRSGNTLGLVSGDHVTVSYTINGDTKSATTTLTSAAKLSDITALFGSTNATMTGANSVIGVDASGYTVNTADGGSVLSITAKVAGVAGSLGGFSINVTDRDNKIKNDENKIFNSFSEAIRAEDKTNDNSLSLQTGTKSNQAINVSLSDMGAKALGIQGQTSTGTVNLNVSTKDRAQAAVNVLDSALQRALTEQTKIGATQSRLEYTSTNLTTSSENVTNAESTIRDADMAKEMMTYSKNNILKQASQAMLAQANQNGQGVLSLLQ
jgi:flagellin